MAGYLPLFCVCLFISFNFVLVYSVYKRSLRGMRPKERWKEGKRERGLGREGKGLSPTVTLSIFSLALFFTLPDFVVVVVPALCLIIVLVHGVNFPWGWQTLGFFIVMSCLARWLDWPVSGDSSKMMHISSADQTRSVKNVPPFPGSFCC